MCGYQDMNTWYVDVLLSEVVLATRTVNFIPNWTPLQQRAAGRGRNTNSIHAELRQRGVYEIPPLGQLRASSDSRTRGPLSHQMLRWPKVNRQTFSAAFPNTLRSTRSPSQSFAISLQWTRTTTEQRLLLCLPLFRAIRDAADDEQTTNLWNDLIHFAASISL